MAGPTLCRNCGEAVRWSLDFRRWLHDGESGRVRYCVKNFTPEHNPTTEAEPIDAAPTDTTGDPSFGPYWPDGD